MRYFKKILCAGQGGQGIVVMGKLLGLAAIAKKYFVSALPSYNAQARGGETICSVVISEQSVSVPVFEKMDYLVAMNQVSYNLFLKKLNYDGIVIFNNSMVHPASSDHNSPKTTRKCHARQIGIPATQIASDIGSVKAANLVMLGAFLKVINIFRIEDVLNVLENFFGDSKIQYLEKNRLALRKGWETV
jgi:2-oxoglutarate ferredoxin oxidoreductase subunit gamma